MNETCREQFIRDGYLMGLDILTAEETQYYLKCFQSYEERLGGSVKGSYR